MLERVDVIAGGFPCTDISVVGSGAGISGKYSGLWKWLLRAVRLVRPRYVVVENVAEIRNRGMGTVLGDLADAGYDAEWDRLSACEVGAPHMRARMFFVAYPFGERWHLMDKDEEIGRANKHFQMPSEWKDRSIKLQIPMARLVSEAVPGVCRVDDGLSESVDGIRQCGLAVVPQVAQKVGEMILQYENRRP